ncbi:hypothetical protein A5696_01655 [Mycobacterium sp. E2699]|uniref:hypothetical protein n=1 Tax=Mycobacterium sp. E2699 TaxID=1834137 RepID=UPI0007FCC51A|nr:hypothetical protein [Mycobacterium sp. E2699]OBH07077.1 hypothetical protein A5696_01655 [Mycobacterium sp. E2699]
MTVDKTYPISDELWTELAGHLKTSGCLLAPALRYMEQGLTPEDYAAAIDANLEYERWKYSMIRDMQRGRVYAGTSEGAHLVAINYRYVLDQPLSPELRHYVSQIIGELHRAFPEVLVTPARILGPQGHWRSNVKPDPPLCPECWQHHVGECL